MANADVYALRPTLSDEVIRKIKHDLRGPAVNVRGFVGEVSGALDELVKLLESHQTALPATFRADMDTLLREDLRPCLDYLEKASLQFHDRIDEAVLVLRDCSTD